MHSLLNGGADLVKSRNFVVTLGVFLVVLMVMMELKIFLNILLVFIYKDLYSKHVLGAEFDLVNAQINERINSDLFLDLDSVNEQTSP